MKTHNRWPGAYLSVVESLMADIRQAARMLVRNVGFTATAVLILAITIGAGAAVFSVVNGVFLTPVPFPESDRLVYIWNGIEPSRSDVVNDGSFNELRQANRSLEAVSAYHESGGVFAPSSVNVPTLARVSWNFFNEVLGIAPLLGRTFTMADEQAASPPVAMISHGFWVSAFGSDPDVLGRQVQVRGLSIGLKSWAFCRRASEVQGISAIRSMSGRWPARGRPSGRRASGSSGV